MTDELVEKICDRCGAKRTDEVDSNICGNCADDLRVEGQEYDDKMRDWQRSQYMMGDGKYDR